MWTGNIGIYFRNSTDRANYTKQSKSETLPKGIKLIYSRGNRVEYETQTKTQKEAFNLFMAQNQKLSNSRAYCINISCGSIIQAWSVGTKD